MTKCKGLMVDPSGLFNQQKKASKQRYYRYTSQAAIANAR